MDELPPQAWRLALLTNSALNAGASIRVLAALINAQAKADDRSAPT
jgi:hypothetical protein